MKNPIWLRLFALPFMAVGIWMLYAIATTLVTGANMKSWDTVNGYVISGGYETNHGEDSDTYKAYATYRYDYKGRSYEGTRVAIDDMSDNIGDFHQELGRKLSAAAGSDSPIDIYVNPDDPSEAVVSRDIRWGLIGFKLIFLIAFGGAGTGLMVFTFMKPRDADPSAFPEQPWLAKKDWADNQIPSGSKLTMYFSWGFAVFWNAISSFIPFVAVEEVQKGNYAILIALLFPLVGIGLVVWAIRNTIQWRKFGQSYLRLDPFPGSINGQVGGTIELHYPYDPAHTFVITLSSIYSYMSGSGKNRSRSEKLNWQDSVVAHTEMGLYGTRIVFRFDVPPDLPPSDINPPGDSYEMWRVNVTAALPGVDLDQDYEIPVFPTAQKSGLTGREIAEAAQRTADMSLQAAKNRIRLINGANGTEFFYPFGRNLGPACTALICGVVFTGACYFLMFHEQQYFFGAIFGLFGVPCALGGIYMAGNSLHVQKDAGGNIVSTRRVFGIPTRRRYIYAGDIRVLETSSNFATQSGNKHIKHFTVYAKTPDGKKVVFGEGFHGEREAGSAIDFFKQEMGIGA